ncbi:serine protease snk-like [Hetaerina americana]|uniref:serine protease snk-like n=1 Tax=Hetaerina americana TaxID=62018 RepID=UPI003A7F1FE3
MTRQQKNLIYGVCIFSLIAACSGQKYPGQACIDSRGIRGKCTPIRQCQIALMNLKMGIRPTNCGFQGNHPVVCCPDGNSRLMSTPQPPPMTTSPSSRQPGERAEEWCMKYSEPCPYVTAVAGGVPALPNEYPHMAAVGYGARNNIQWLCGGTLISENFILTAAHCLRGGSAGPARWILLGTVNLALNESYLGEAGQIHEVIRRIRHPGYRPPAKYDDVALLEIGPAFTRNHKPLITKELHPACLKTIDSPSYGRFIATGWGRVGFGEDPSMELLKVELDVFDETKCNQTFEDVITKTNQLRRGIDSTMLCAGILSGGKDTCQGDSGGPLQVARTGACQFQIWGITSFGKICSFANSPSVYMKVSAYIEWIEDIVWPA